jgi:antirestriction protein ArdC
MGGGARLFAILDGIVSSITGKFAGNPENSNDMEIEIKGHPTIPNGIYTASASRLEGIRAVLGDDALKNLNGRKGAFGPDQRKLAVPMADLLATRKDAPTGWNANGDGSFTSADGYNVTPDGNGGWDIKDENGALVGNAPDWANVQKMAAQNDEKSGKAPKPKARLKKEDAKVEEPAGFAQAPGDDDDLVPEMNRDQRKREKFEAVSKAAEAAGFEEITGDWDRERNIRRWEKNVNDLYTEVTSEDGKFLAFHQGGTDRETGGALDEYESDLGASPTRAFKNVQKEMDNYLREEPFDAGFAQSPGMDHDGEFRTPDSEIEKAREAFKNFESEELEEVRKNFMRGKPDIGFEIPLDPYDPYAVMSVAWGPAEGKWYASAQLRTSRSSVGSSENGDLGYFDTPEEAMAAAIAFKNDEDRMDEYNQERDSLQKERTAEVQQEVDNAISSKDRDALEDLLNDEDVVDSDIEKEINRALEGISFDEEIEGDVDYAISEGDKDLIEGYLADDAYSEQHDRLDKALQELEDQEEDGDGFAQEPGDGFVRIPGPKNQTVDQVQGKLIESIAKQTGKPLQEILNDPDMQKTTNDIAKISLGKTDGEYDSLAREIAKNAGIDFPGASEGFVRVPGRTSMPAGLAEHKFNGPEGEDYTSPDGRIKISQRLETEYKDDGAKRVDYEDLEVSVDGKRVGSVTRNKDESSSEFRQRAADLAQAGIDNPNYAADKETERQARIKSDEDFRNSPEQVAKREADRQAASEKLAAKEAARKAADTDGLLNRVDEFAKNVFDDKNTYYSDDRGGDTELNVNPTEDYDGRPVIDWTLLDDQGDVIAEGRANESFDEKDVASDIRDGINQYLDKKSGSEGGFNQAPGGSDNNIIPGEPSGPEDRVAQGYAFLDKEDSKPMYGGGEQTRWTANEDANGEVAEVIKQVSKDGVARYYANNSSYSRGDNSWNDVASEGPFDNALDAFESASSMRESESNGWNEDMASEWDGDNAGLAQAPGERKAARATTSVPRNQIKEGDLVYDPATNEVQRITRVYQNADGIQFNASSTKYPAFVGPRGDMVELLDDQSGQSDREILQTTGSRKFLKKAGDVKVGDTVLDPDTDAPLKVVSVRQSTRASYKGEAYDSPITTITFDDGTTRDFNSWRGNFALPGYLEAKAEEDSAGGLAQAPGGESVNADSLKVGDKVIDSQGNVAEVVKDGTTDIGGTPAINLKAADGRQYIDDVPEDGLISKASPDAPISPSAVSKMAAKEPVSYGALGAYGDGSVDITEENGKWKVEAWLFGLDRNGDNAEYSRSETFDTLEQAQAFADEQADKIDGTPETDIFTEEEQNRAAGFDQAPGGGMSDVATPAQYDFVKNVLDKQGSKLPVELRDAMEETLANRSATKGDIGKIIGEMNKVIDPNVPSDRQLNSIRRGLVSKGLPAKEVADITKRLPTMTKGEASDLITRLKGMEDSNGWTDASPHLMKKNSEGLDIRYTPKGDGTWDATPVSEQGDELGASENFKTLAAAEDAVDGINVADLRGQDDVEGFAQSPGGPVLPDAIGNPKNWKMDEKGNEFYESEDGRIKVTFEPDADVDDEGRGIDLSYFDVFVDGEKVGSVNAPTARQYEFRGENEMPEYLVDAEDYIEEIQSVIDGDGQGFEQSPGGASDALAKDDSEGFAQQSATNPDFLEEDPNALELKSPNQKEWDDYKSGNLNYTDANGNMSTIKSGISKDESGKESRSWYATYSNPANRNGTGTSTSQLFDNPEAAEKWLRKQIADGNKEQNKEKSGGFSAKQMEPATNAQYDLIQEHLDEREFDATTSQAITEALANRNLTKAQMSTLIGQGQAAPFKPGIDPTKPSDRLVNSLTSKLLTKDIDDAERKDILDRIPGMKRDEMEALNNKLRSKKDIPGTAGFAQEAGDSEDSQFAAKLQEAGRPLEDYSEDDPEYDRIQELLKANDTHLGDMAKKDPRNYFYKLVSAAVDQGFEADEIKRVVERPYNFHNLVLEDELKGPMSDENSAAGWIDRIERSQAEGGFAQEPGEPTDSDQYNAAQAEFDYQMSLEPISRSDRFPGGLRDERTGRVNSPEYIAPDEARINDLADRLDAVLKDADFNLFQYSSGKELKDDLNDSRYTDVGIKFQQAESLRDLANELDRKGGDQQLVADLREAADDIIASETFKSPLKAALYDSDGSSVDLYSAGEMANNIRKAYFETDSEELVDNIFFNGDFYGDVRSGGVEGRVFETEDGKYEADYSLPDGNGVEETQTFDDRDEAVSWLAMNISKYNSSLVPSSFVGKDSYSSDLDLESELDDAEKNGTGAEFAERIRDLAGDIYDARGGDRSVASGLEDFADRAEANLGSAGKEGGFAQEAGTATPSPKMGEPATDAQYDYLKELANSKQGITPEMAAAIQDALSSKNLTKSQVGAFLGQLRAMENRTGVDPTKPTPRQVQRAKALANSLGLSPAEKRALGLNRLTSMSADEIQSLIDNLKRRGGDQGGSGGVRPKAPSGDKPGGGAAGQVPGKLVSQTPRSKFYESQRTDMPEFVDRVQKNLDKYAAEDPKIAKAVESFKKKYPEGINSMIDIARDPKSTQAEIDRVAKDAADLAAALDASPLKDRPVADGAPNIYKADTHVLNSFAKYYFGERTPELNQKDMEKVTKKHSEGSTPDAKFSATYNPNLEEYRSSQEGVDSAIGYVSLDALQDMAGNEIRSDYVVDSIAKDLKDGVGFKEPIILIYDPKTGRSFVTEGNHRVQAARKAGVKYVPVRVVNLQNAPGDVSKMNDLGKGLGRRPAPDGLDEWPADIQPKDIFPAEDLLPAEISEGFSQKAAGPASFNDLKSAIGNSTTDKADGGEYDWPTSEGFEQKAGAEGPKRHRVLEALAIASTIMSLFDDKPSARKGKENVDTVGMFSNDLRRIKDDMGVAIEKFKNPKKGTDKFDAILDFAKSVGDTVAAYNRAKARWDRNNPRKPKAGKPGDNAGRTPRPELGQPRRELPRGGLRPVPGDRPEQGRIIFDDGLPKIPTGGRNWPRTEEEQKLWDKYVQDPRFSPLEPEFRPFVGQQLDLLGETFNISTTPPKGLPGTPPDYVHSDGTKVWMISPEMQDKLDVMDRDGRDLPYAGFAQDLLVGPNNTSPDAPKTVEEAISQNAKAEAELLKSIKERIAAGKGRAHMWSRGYKLETGPDRYTDRVTEDNLPINPASDHVYSASNMYLLAEASADRGYSDRRWMTYKQAEKMGATVREGEQGIQILTPVQTQLADGSKVTTMKPTWVFNAEQMDNLGPDTAPKASGMNAGEALDFVLMRFNEAERARGRKGLDIKERRARDATIDAPRWVDPTASRAERLTMPDRSQYDSPAAYLQTLLHELTHSVGHQSRMARESNVEALDNKGSGDQYQLAMEELTAELGSAVLMRRLGVPFDSDMHAEYVKSWMDAAKLSEADLNKAFTEAQLAADYVLGNDVLPKWDNITTDYEKAPTGFRPNAGRTWNPDPKFGPDEAAPAVPAGTPGSEENPDIVGFAQAAASSKDGKKVVKDSQSAMDKVTAQIIDSLKEGKLPWRKPFKGIAGANMQRNPASKRIYTGFNQQILAIIQAERGYNDPRWMTYNQAQGMGGQVRKGEKGVFILVPMRMAKEDAVTGEDKSFVMFKAVAVFNAEQIDGLNLPTLESEAEGKQMAPLDAHEFVVERYKKAMEARTGKPVDITYRDMADTESPHWSPTTDKIVLPSQKQFNSPEDMFDTMAHEMVHSTGHGSRLDRTDLTKDYGNADGVARAKEELIAEIGAATIADMFGVETTLDNSTAYVRSWLGRLQNHPEEVIQASREAQKAVDYLLGIDIGDWSPLNGYGPGNAVDTDNKKPEE